jgi:DNA-binding CsgD family transcriptional regulator
MKNAAMLAHIRQLCCLGLGGRAIMPALLKAVRELVPSDSAEFFWVDARGEMSNHYAEQMLPADVMQYYFRRADAESEHPFFASFKTRAAQPDAVTTLTVTDAFRRTDLYRSVIQHLGAEHALYCVIRERDCPLGQLSLYRGKKRAPFGASERAAIAAIAGYIAHGLDDSFGAGKYAAVDQSYRDTDHQAMLTLERDGTLRHCSSAARRLLLYVTLDLVNRGTVAQQGVAIGGLMRELADQLTAVFVQPEDIAAAPPAMVVTNRWGRFVLRAYWLTDDVHAPDALIGAQIRRQEPMVLRLSQAMQRLSLSPQQKEVGLLLAQGKSNPEIAGALGVSLNTANYHVKQLFAKLNTHERTEVAPKLLGMSDGAMRTRASQ